MRKSKICFFKMGLKALCLFTSILSVMSCDPKPRGGNGESGEGAVEERFLTSKRLYVPDMLFPMDISVSDKHGWILITERQSPKWVSVFDFEGNLIHKFADDGEGAAEQLSSKKLQWKEGNREVILFDFHKNSFFTYSVENEKMPPIELIGSTKVNVSRLKSPVFLPSGGIIDFNADGAAGKLINKFDSNGKMIASAIDYPKSDYPMEDFLYPEAFSGYINYFPSNGNVLVNLFFSDRLYLLDTNLSLLASYTGPDNFLPAFKGKDVAGGGKLVSHDFERSRFGFLSLSTIYKNTFLIGYHGGMATEGELIQRIIQFDSALRPIKIFNFDAPVSKFAISETGSRIYAILDESEGYLVYFDIE